MAHGALTPIIVLRLLALAAGLRHNAEIGQPGLCFSAYGHKFGINHLAGTRCEVPANRQASASRAPLGWRRARPSLMGTRSLPAVDRTDTPQPSCGKWGLPKTYPHRSPTRTSRASPRHMTLVQAVLGGPRRVLDCRSPPSQGGGPRYRAAGRFAGALQPRSELDSPPDGNAEVLCGAVLDNKNPDFRGFSSYQSPLTDSNRRPPPYH